MHPLSISELEDGFGRAIIGFFLTFVPNLSGFVATGDLSKGAVAMGVTALTKNPFLGMVAGVLVGYLGGFFGI